MKRVKLGFIGLGYITTRWHLPAFLEMAKKGEVILQAFCDSNEETMKKQAGIFGVDKVYTDYREMLDQENLDGLYVCIPPTLHVDAELMAAEQGIALFVEKPQTLDMAQAILFDKVIQKAGIVSQVGFMSRFYPSAERVQEVLDARRPRHALVQLLYSGVPLRYWTSRFELCGGSFVENTIHMVDLLRFFLGDIYAVSAFYVNPQEGEGPKPMNMPHVYNVNYWFESGVTANVTTSRVLNNVSISRREFLLISDDSLVEWSEHQVLENGEIILGSKGKKFNAFEAQARTFVKAIRKGNPDLMPSPYSVSLNSLAAVLGANFSAENGGELIRLKDFSSEKN